MAQNQFSSGQCLAVVERSPAAVSVHDKDAWLGIFAMDAIVEDPVGSRPHVSGIKGGGTPRGPNDVLGRFYETFIAPNGIRFHVDRDIVCGLHVVRDLTLEIAMSSEVTVRVPMHLLYELQEQCGELRVSRLAAHWELRPMLQQQMAFSWPHLKVGVASAWRMLRFLGVGGIAGFMRASSSVGAAGKQRVKQFSECFNHRRRDELAALFASTDVLIHFPYGERSLTIEQFSAMAGELQAGKILAAGNVVSVSMRCQSEQVSGEGVAFFELDRSNLQIVALSFYM